MLARNNVNIGKDADMADSTAPELNAGLWARLAHHRTSYTPRNLQYRLVHYGYWSAGIMLILMLLDLIVPSLFAGHYVAIGVIYLCMQLAEIASRNPLKPGEVIEGIVLAFAPSLVGLVFLVLDWHSNYTMLTRTGWDVMALWFVFSWMGFIDGVVMAIQQLETPYRRSENFATRT